MAGTWWWRQPPLLLLRTMMMSATPGAEVSAAEDKAQADDLHQAHGGVRPRTKQSCSRWHSLSSEDPTKNRQSLLASPPDRLVAGVFAALKAMPSTWCYGDVPAIGWRQCCSSRVGGGRLLKVAQEDSISGPNSHRLLHHINSCINSWRSLPRTTVCCV